MNINYSKHCLLFFTLFYSTGIIAQQQPVALKFETLTIDDGLSQGFVSGITQDRKGFMWFSTLDGLDRYDGYNFVSYHHDNNDANSIASNFVYSVFEDSKQRLWISTWNNGLDYFDREYHQFHHFFKGAYVRYACEDGKGNLWTTINDTILVCIRVKTEVSKQNKTQSVSLDTTQFSFPASTRIYVMVDDKKNVYISSKYFLNKLVPLPGNLHFSMQRILSFSAPEVSELRQDITTHKYYFQINNELFEFKNDQFINPVKIADKDNYNKFYIDKSGYLWFGYKEDIQQNSYAKIINLQTHDIRTINSQNSLYNKFFGYLYAPFQDRNGTLWFGTAGFGILKYAQSQNRFNLVLPQDKFFGLMPVHNTDLLVNYRLKIHVNKNYTIRLDTLHPSIAPVFNMLRLTDMGFDSTGYYWIGNGNKLIQYDPEANNVIQTIIIKDSGNKILTQKLAAVFDKNGDLQKNHTYGIIGFFADDSYVLMCLDDLLLSYNILTKKITTYPFIKISKHILVSLNYYKDVQGFIWINSDYCCYKLNIKTGESIKYAFKPTTNRMVRCFCDDPAQPRKYIWLGTLNGLTRMNKQTGICDNFFGKNGLPTTLIFGILSDSMQTLWISSTNGLYRLHLNNYHVEKFDVTDGLQGNEFNTYSYAKMKNGLLFFGGLSGLNFFKPEDIKPLPAPSVIITDVKLFGKTINFGTKNSPLQKDIIYTNNISASFKSNIISFEFAGLDYSKKQALQYRYMLKGFDEGWNSSGSVNTATYTNLNPGTYFFIVEATNKDSVWGPASKALQINITPLWWQTWMFKILIITVLISLTYLFYRYRLHNALRIERVRNRIASDLHDEIGSTLSTLDIYSKIAQNQLEVEQSKTIPVLAKMSDNISQAMDAMSEIVWSVNAKNDKFENIITHMQNLAFQVLEAKDYNVNFHTDDNVRNLNLKMEKRRDFYLIYKEAINNIAKHAQGENVWINLKENGKLLSLIIKDDGKGFNQSTIRKEGNGLLNMKDRAISINGKISINSSPEFNGTTIELNLLYN